jgi:hypothetical protein
VLTASRYAVCSKEERASEERRENMDPLYDLHSWSEHYREEALREAHERHLQQGTADSTKGVKGMTKYYFRIGKYFLSTMVLTGFGLNLRN